MRGSSLARDSQPGNILFTSTGITKLVDFGLVKLMQDDPNRTYLDTKISLVDRRPAIQYVCVMQPEELLDTLMVIAPAFRTQWTGPDNYFLGNDGNYTLHGAFAEFSRFFQENGDSLSDEQCRRIGDFVSQCMSAPGTDLDNAAATCFIENLAGETPSHALRLQLTGEALTYLEKWGG